jgi:hypothetical protein
VAQRGRKSDPDVVRITAAPHNLEQDIGRRQRRYLISMTIRTLCFISAVLCFRIPWLCGLLLAASLLLPFVAVVIANAAAPRVPQALEGPGVGRDSGYHELRSGSDPTD